MVFPTEQYPILVVKPLENVADAEEVTEMDNVMTWQNC